MGEEDMRDNQVAQCTTHTQLTHTFLVYFFFFFFFPVSIYPYGLDFKCGASSEYHTTSIPNAIEPPGFFHGFFSNIRICYLSTVTLDATVVYPNLTPKFQRPESPVRRLQ